MCRSFIRLNRFGILSDSSCNQMILEMSSSEVEAMNAEVLIEFLAGELHLLNFICGWLVEKQVAFKFNQRFNCLPKTFSKFFIWVLTVEKTSWNKVLKHREMKV